MAGMNHKKMADAVMSSIGHKSAEHDEPDGDEPEEEGEGDGEEKEPKEKAGHLGKMLRAAIREGDDEAIEEAICKIVEEHGDRY